MVSVFNRTIRTYTYANCEWIEEQRDSEKREMTPAGCPGIYGFAAVRQSFGESKSMRNRKGTRGSERVCGKW